MNNSIGLIIEGLNYNRVDEAKQKIIVLAYKWNGYKLCEIICNTQTYNKLKKLPGYKEIDKAEFDSDESVKRFYNYLKDKIDKYGINGFTSDENGEVSGEYGKLGYGYNIPNDSKLKLVSDYASMHIDD